MKVNCIVVNTITRYRLNVNKCEVVCGRLYVGGLYVGGCVWEVVCGRVVCGRLYVGGCMW